MLCLALILLAALPARSSALPRLESDTGVASAGYYQLQWTIDTPEVAIEETSGNAPTTSIIYKGPDRATLRSGLADGQRSYRAGELDKNGSVIAWSEPVEVTTAHHPLNRALAFFAIGAVVFIATLLLIVGGARRYR